MSWSRSHKHCSSRAPALNLLSKEQYAPYRRRMRSGTSGVRDSWTQGRAPLGVSDEGVLEIELDVLKAVSLFVCAFEAQERFSVGGAMLREIGAGELSGPSRCA